MKVDSPTSRIWRRQRPGRPSGRAVDPNGRGSPPAIKVSNDKRRKIYDSIQYLRAISAVMVIFFHSAIQSTDLSGRYVPAWGKFGVDIFFVISGFVMWESVADRSTSPIVFLKKRFCRIVPLYWAFTLAAALIAFVEPHLLRSTVFDLPHLMASLAFVPWANPAAASASPEERLTPVINPGWALNFEMLFYLMFALILLVPRHTRLPVMLAAMLFVHYAAGSLHDLGAIPQFYAQKIVFEFLFGMCVAVLLSHYRSSMPLLAASLALVALAILLWADLAQPAVRRWIWLGMPAAVLIAAVVDLERAGWVPKIGWLGRIGAASYSIYLGHVFVIAGARIAIQWSGSADGLMQPMIFIPLGIGASVGIGMIVHHLIERPLTALSARQLGVA